VAETEHFEGDLGPTALAWEDAVLGLVVLLVVFAVGEDRKDHFEAEEANTQEAYVQVRWNVAVPVRLAGLVLVDAAAVAGDHVVMVENRDHTAQVSVVVGMILVVDHSKAADSPGLELAVPHIARRVNIQDLDPLAFQTPNQTHF